MGYGHILLVRDDAIRTVVPRDKAPDELALEVGRAVLKACLGKDLIPDDNGEMVQDRTASIFNYGNGVESAGERHTNEEDLFLWAANCLRPIRGLDLEVLQRIRDEVDKLIAERRGRQ